MDLIKDFPLFLTSCVVLAVMPGPDTLLTVGRTLVAGKRAGVLALAGILSGCCAHIALAAFGLSALLAASPTLYMVVKWIGALYLAWLGFQILRTASMESAQVTLVKLRENSAFAMWRQGFITNLFNPKVGLFFISFLPQFVNPSAGSPLQTGLAFATLGLIFTVIGGAWMVCVLYTAEAFAVRMKRKSAVTLWLNRVVGVLFIGVAVRIAIAEK